MSNTTVSYLNAQMYSYAAAFTLPHGKSISHNCQGLLEHRRCDKKRWSHVKDFTFLLSCFSFKNSKCRRCLFLMSDTLNAGGKLTVSSVFSSFTSTSVSILAGCSVVFVLSLLFFFFLPLPFCVTGTSVISILFQQCLRRRRVSNFTCVAIAASAPSVLHFRFTRFAHLLNTYIP